MTRGTQAPTIFGLWTALLMISSVLRRSTWLAWPFHKYYTNLYVFLVAVPALCGKSTILGIADDILTDYHKYLPDEGLARLKKLKIFRDKITPEAIYHYMQPDMVAIKGSNGRTRMVSTGTEALFMASDLPTMLGRQNYNEGLVSQLMRLYDCGPSADYHSVGHGRLVIPKPYTTLAGGIPPGSISDMLPIQTMSSGFLSRVTMVYTPPLRNYHIMRYVDGAPDVHEMQRRLAWIVNNIRGEFSLAPEALALYANWHEKSFWLPMIKDPEEYQEARSRVRNMVLKVATLLRANRYDPGEAHGGTNVVDAEDMANAIAIIDQTYLDSEKAFDKIGKDDYSKDVEKVERCVQRLKTCKLAEITSSTKIRKKGTNLLQILNILVQEGLVVVTYNGKERNRATGQAGELFHWKAWYDNRRKKKDG